MDVILSSGREGIIISSISRKANLSHYPTLQKCDSLVSAGLIELKIVQPNNVFTMTEKGFQFFQEYRKFKNLTDSLKLR